MFRHYARRARQRAIDWQLTREQFAHLTSLDCAYCGAGPSTRFYPRFNRTLGTSERIESVERVNGVDRIDSAKGYTLQNCAPACWDCNRMKASLDRDEFIAHARKIAGLK